MSIKDEAIKHAVTLLGTDYSQSARLRLYPGGSMDCSSYQYGNYSYAGFPLLDSRGNELTTSCYEVDAVGFELIYPGSRSLIGKVLPSPAGLASTYGAEPGDLIFYNFNRATARKNRITHVAMVYDGASIIHTANNRDKCCIAPIGYGDGDICAITRLKRGVVLPPKPVVRQGDKGAFVRMMQIMLNAHGARLNCDGSAGAATIAALNDFKRAHGMEADGVCGGEVWPALAGKSAPTAARKAVEVMGGSVNVRERPDTSSPVVWVAHRGDVLPRLDNGWYRVELGGKTGYISARDDLTKQVG